MKMNIDDEGAVLEILASAQLPLNQLEERTMVNRRGRVTRLRLAPCLGMDRLPSVIRELSHLEQLYLFWGGRDLTCLPSELFKLPNLKVLHIRRCQGLRRIMSDGDSCGTKPSFSNLEELIIEGCDHLTDLSCLMGRTTEPLAVSSSLSSSLSSSFWPKLKHLHIVDCPRANIVKTFGTRLEQQQPQQHEVFPSLLNLSLRDNEVTGPDLVRLWQFFLSQCPQLEDVDLSDNQISTLEDLVRSLGETKLDSPITAVDSRKPSFPSLRRLNLAGNPILERQERGGESDVVSDSDDQRQDQLMRLLHANPQLCSIVRCESGQRSSTPTTASGLGLRRCFVGSALYSTKTQHALDLNRCSRGERTLQSDTARFPLAMWPLVLQRAHATVTAPDDEDNDVSVVTTSPDDPSRAYVPPTSLYACRCRQGQDCDNIIHPKQREASIIYSLLQGAVFASRGGIVKTDLALL